MKNKAAKILILVLGLVIGATFPEIVNQAIDIVSDPALYLFDMVKEAINPTPVA